MTQIYEYTGLYIILFWVFFRGLYPFVSLKGAVFTSASILGVLSIFGSSFMFLMIAIFAPLGALLPALALQNIARKFNLYKPVAYPVYELILVLIIYVAFLSASIGVFSFDPYRYGYNPTLGSIIAFVTCCYALWRGYIFIAGALILGQIAWALGVSSSNYFDHITHVMLVPVILTTLIKKTVKTFHNTDPQYAEP